MTGVLREPDRAYTAGVRGPRACFVGVVLAAGAAAGAAQPPDRSQTTPFRSSIELTVVTATVRDGNGRLVQGLPRTAFEIYEDGERQAITQFTNERVALGLGLLLDISESMFGERIRAARAAVERFLFDLLAPSDEFFVLAFNHEPHILTGWTRTPSVVREALDRVRPFGGTAIYDAVMGALPLVRSRSRERAAARSRLGASAQRHLRLRDRDRRARSSAEPHRRQPGNAERDHRPERRLHRDRARARRSRRRDGADRRGVEQPIRDRVFIPASRRRPLPQHPRQGGRRRLSRARAQRLRRGSRAEDGQSMNSRMGDDG
ncbi:MAG: hypothetical protein DMF86_17155 [Acidobacteria bacterium]|nr:MAG: hypothetical protein DMF86_17155 [Acidobacteriota bacterium]